jgi:hypothetical protein
LGLSDPIGGARPWEMREGRAALLLVGALTIARFVIAPIVPLAFDEAYYWRWSTHLAFGYFDHPPMVAWLIAAGTALAGDSVFGIRLVPLVLSIPAGWAVWRSAAILFGDAKLAMAALVFFNLVLIVSVGTVLATPDAALLIASAFLLYCLARGSESGRPAWWIAAGVVTGLGCLAKFTALFWLPSILIWLLLVPTLRPSLRTIWPWLGALAAVLVYLPNLIWNAENGWVTFAKQFGRVAANGFEPQFLAEHLGLQIGMATPVIFVLGWLALAAFVARRGGNNNARILLGALVWPTTIYFLYHSLHARVEGDWTGPIFPAFVIAAAVTIYAVEWRGAVARVVAVLARFAAPAGLLVVLLVYSQTLFGWAPLGLADPTATRIGSGMQAVADDVDEIRLAEGASLVVTLDYGTAAWLSFYGRARPPLVEQVNERERWLQEPPLDPDRVAGPLLAVLPADTLPAQIRRELGQAEYLTTLTRKRGSLDIADYAIYLLPGGLQH